MLQIESLQKIFSNQLVLHFPDFSLQNESQALLLGSSGCGKTTLLHLLAGLLRPSKGDVWLDGTSLSSLSNAQLDKFRGQHIGIVFQQTHFIQSLSVFENLILAQSLAGNKPDARNTSNLLETLGIAHKKNALPHQLSQGEQQRVSIARALANKPKLILADEPTSALDDHNAQEVVQLLTTQAQQHAATLLIVTHDARIKEKLPQHIYLNPLIPSL